ncbi:U32 family peptidase, partial [Phascolarctobacterium faecium]|nr:U32 family peptidase [Phascolarctobacterium faecium]
MEGGRPCDLMSLKDLCTIDLLPELMEAGIDSFKIEGRMKQPDYVYTVTSLYRKYADLYCQKGRAGY